MRVLFICNPLYGHLYPDNIIVSRYNLNIFTEIKYECLPAE